MPQLTELIEDTIGTLDLQPINVEAQAELRALAKQRGLTLAEAARIVRAGLVGVLTSLAAIAPTGQAAQVLSGVLAGWDAAGQAYAAEAEGGAKK